MRKLILLTLLAAIGTSLLPAQSAMACSGKHHHHKKA
jgi:hypothetical protein